VTTDIVARGALDYQTEGSTDPKGCNAIPFMNEGAPRDDIGRDYREIATAAAVHDDTDSAVGGLDVPTESGCTSKTPQRM
uniref:hypothetical protein n=1 Tax=Mycobacterium avium TaxID=1764 RepID=UPI001593EFF9